MEEWKNIEGYNNYQVSTLANIRCTKNGKNRLLKTFINNSGTESIYIQKSYDRKCYTVRVLVARAFLPNPKNCKYTKQIHKSLGNRADNIEWIEAREYKPRPRKKSKLTIFKENRELISEGYKYKNAWMNSLERQSIKELNGK